MGIYPSLGSADKNGSDLGQKPDPDMRIKMGAGESRPDSCSDKSRPAGIEPACRSGIITKLNERWRGSIADGRGRRLFQRRKPRSRSWPGCYLLTDESTHRWFGHICFDSTARLSIRAQRADGAHTRSYSLLQRTVGDKCILSGTAITRKLPSR